MNAAPKLPFDVVPTLPRSVLLGDCRESMRAMTSDSIDSIVSDPPYGISFMGKGWDHDVPGVDFWTEALRVAKPGAFLLAFGGTRKAHRLAVAIEDAGWEIRDSIAWMFGSGFPKSLDVSKAMDASGRIEFSRDRVLRFTEFMRSTGITGAEINEATGTNMGSHYLTDKQQPAVATEPLFDLLRPLIRARGVSIPADIEQLVEWRTAESENMKRRKVVGSASMPIGAGFAGDRYVGDSVGSKAVNITRANTDLARKWEGWGTALKPAHEPVIVARKPFAGTVARNVAMHGTGAINVDGCRIETIDGLNGGTYSGGKRNPTPGDTRSATAAGRYGEDGRLDPSAFVQPSGRWPANVILDEEAGATLDASVDASPPKAARMGVRGGTNPAHMSRDRGDNDHQSSVGFWPSDPGGGPSRFFYCAKSSKSERTHGGHVENKHPTVKPIALMRYLVRLVTPPGGLVLDPFCGSGSTGVATVGEGFGFIGCELDETHAEVARARIAHEESMR